MQANITANNRQIQPQPSVVDLNQKGFMDAGQVNGNPDDFNMKLNTLYQKVETGKIISSTIDRGSLEYGNQNPVLIEESIIECRNQISWHRNRINEIDEDISNKRTRRTEVEEEIRKYEAGELNPNKGGFSWLKFGISSFFLLMVTVFLFLFYTSTIYKALFMDLTILAERLANGLGGQTALPSPQEMRSALRSNILVWFSPFIFFGFGYAIHIILEWTIKPISKYLVLASVVGITFLLDLLMAYKIHSNTNEALSLMGLEIEQWQSSPTFYIIILMGFVVFIIWSILLHAWMTEWGKRDIGDRLYKIVDDIIKSIEKLNQEKLEIRRKIEKLTANIDELERKKDLPRISKEFLETCIREYADGWFRYCAAAGDSLLSTTEKCRAIYNKKIELHFSN